MGQPGWGTPPQAAVSVRVSGSGGPFVAPFTRPGSPLSLRAIVCRWFLGNQWV